jgi:hypothetical protein
MAVTKNWTAAGAIPAVVAVDKAPAARERPASLAQPTFVAGGQRTRRYAVPAVVAVDKAPAARVRPASFAQPTFVAGGQRTRRYAWR